MLTPLLRECTLEHKKGDLSNFTKKGGYYTKLDACSLCHQGGNITQNGKISHYGSCDYCHQIYGLQPPHGDIRLTLNPYGSAYDKAGRSQDALRSIEGLDSDGDTYTNIVEIKALTFPGDPKDHPGLIPAPAIVMN
jgi:hypothetical protein